MSEQPAEGVDPGVVELAPSGLGTFNQLMDTLAPEATGGEAPAAGDTAVPGTAADGSAAATAPADGGAAGTPAADKPAGDGDTGGAATPGDGKPADGAAAGDASEHSRGDLPAEWTRSGDELVTELGQLSTTFEESTQNAYRAEALADVRKEHENYFTALEKHPRLLVGTEVPAVGKDGMETLQSTQDAKDWQDAVKSILVQEVQSRASVKLDENRDFIQTIHASIDLFKNNPDLTPGNKDFDVDLANKFATFAKPYELRVDGKLHGYSVPVQPLIDQLREQVIAERAKTAAPEATSPASGAAVTPPVDGPQAGVQSKAGSGEQAESFETLFGTIGLPNLKI